MYKYNAKILRVIDGDTFEVGFDLGFGINSKQTVRVYNLDTFETRLIKGTTKADKRRGLEAKRFATQRLEGKDFIMETYKDKKGKYGRYLVSFRCPGLDGMMIDYASLMKHCGFQKPTS